MKRKTVYAKCEPCKGTGLYVGFMEAVHKEAVICTNCGGAGCDEITYTPFTKRIRRRRITHIRAGSGLILDRPTEQDWMTYKEFEQHVPAPKRKK